MPIALAAEDVPLAVGTLAQRRWPGASARIGVPLTKVAGIATTVALVVVLVLIFPSVWELVSPTTVAAMLVFNIGAVAVGHLLGGPERSNSIVLGISCASRHPSVALTIASVNYPGRSFAAAVVLCLALNGIVCGAYAKWLSVDRSDPAGAAGVAPVAEI